MANQKEIQIADEVFALIDESLDNMHEFWKRYRTYLLQFQFLRQELDEELPELREIVINQLVELISNWKHELHPQPKLAA